MWRGLLYLFNITHQVNTSNAVVAEYNFDAWGRRRSADDWSFTIDGDDLPLFADRGFTAHEHLPWFSLVNMNGRLYDPLVGRFLNVDPYVQMPYGTQSYNRYSYCLNNPLRYTDPSGYKLKWPKFEWRHLIPVIGQLEYVMQTINDNTEKTREKMSKAGIPNLNVGVTVNGAGNLNARGDIMGQEVFDTEKMKRSKDEQIAVDNFAVSLEGVRIRNWQEWHGRSGGGFGTSLNIFNDVLNASGMVAGGAELFTEANADARILYTTINGTSAWVSSAKVISTLKAVGTYTVVGSVVVDLSLGASGYQTPGKTITNIGIGIGTWAIGGIPGLVIGVGYTVFDKTGMLDRPYLPHYTPPSIAMPDATRVVQPIIKY